jgi:parvulin-like peptidyl-prolyl isomerase
MKKITLLAIGLAMMLAATGCKRAGDVLVTYKGGQITRGEFYDWLDARKMAKDAILKKKSQQKSHLERFATEKLEVAEARKAGFDKSDDYQYRNKFAERSFYAQYMGRLISTEGKFSEKAAKAQIIKLTVKNYKIVNNKREKLSDSEQEAAFAEQKEKARSIIKELDKGSSFSDLAKKYSDDFSKRKGGDVGFVIEGMRGEDFSKAVFAVKKGEFTKEPVVLGNSVYIIKVIEAATITEKNIEDVIDDKAQQEGMKRRLTYNSAQRLQDNLMKVKDVENFTDTVNLSDPAAVIYKVGNVQFTVGDLNKLVGYVMENRKKTGHGGVQIEEKMKREWPKRLLREEVLMREAIKRGINKDEKFKKELKFFSDYNLAGTYEAESVLTNITVTPQDVSDYYNKNMEKMYTRTMNEGGKSVKKVIPFGEVRQSIEYRLNDLKKSEKRKSWVADLLSKNSFKVNDSELEGK